MVLKPDRTWSLVQRVGQPKPAGCAGTGCQAKGWDAAVRAACQPPKPPSQAAQLEVTMRHQLGVLELLVQHSALLLRLTARMAAASSAAAAAAPVWQQAKPRQDSNSSQPANTACLADDAASECHCSSRSKRARPGADGDDSEALSPPSWKRACLASGPQKVLPRRPSLLQLNPRNPQTTKACCKNLISIKPHVTRGLSGLPQHQH